jgi:hypothetical protein
VSDVDRANPTTAHAGSLPDLDALEAGLAAVVSTDDRSRSRVVEREPNWYASTFASELVTVAHGNATCVLFCKHGIDAVDPRWGHRRGAPYEALVYEHVLVPYDADVPRWLGSFDGAHGTTLVFEFLTGAAPIHECDAGVESAVVRAASRLGVWHRTGEAIASDPPCPGLNEYRADDSGTWRGGSGRGPFDSLLASPRFRPLATVIERNVDVIVAALGRSFPTVVHGELHSPNVLAQGSRTYFVDWETAGIGPGELDLAALTVGSWTEPTRAACEQAYVEGRWDGRAPSSFDDALAAARLHVLADVAHKTLGGFGRKEVSTDWIEAQFRVACDRLGIR